MIDHEKWMEQAFIEAEKAYNKKEVPVGSIIVFEDKIIGRGHNLVESLQDPTAHSEMLTITAAANFLASWRLEDTKLYTTLEPCPMCAGAILLSRIPQIIYGASDSKMGACGTVINLLNHNSLNSNVQVIGGILQDKCQSILKSFFEKLRDGEVPELA